jgi:hypothetical protein
MPSGYELLANGKYAQALTQLKCEAKKDKHDDFNISAVSKIGMALIGLGRFAEACEHYQSLIAKTWCKISCHFIGAGLAKWCEGDHTGAVDFWRKGLKTGYATYKGLDVRFVMFYAAVKDPDCIDLNEVRKEVSSKAKNQMGVTAALAHYLLGDIDETQLYQTPGLMSEKPGLFDEGEQDLLDFYVGTEALHNGNRRKSLKMMRAMAWRTKDYITAEHILARLELGQIGKES